MFYRFLNFGQSYGLMKVMKEVKHPVGRLTEHVWCYMNFTGKLFYKKEREYARMHNQCPTKGIFAFYLIIIAY